mmetsp:Transcript_2014/g.4314  ORF Transcript_2014/g.4314 Transcript_2014/m.4314 type:complete len:241 (-) Transcript_2014:280-1002(-)
MTMPPMPPTTPRSPCQCQTLRPGQSCTEAPPPHRCRRRCHHHYAPHSKLCRCQQRRHPRRRHRRRYRRNRRCCFPPATSVRGWPGSAQTLSGSCPQSAAACPETTSRGRPARTANSRWRATGSRQTAPRTRGGPSRTARSTFAARTSERASPCTQTRATPCPPEGRWPSCRGRIGKRKAECRGARDRTFCRLATTRIRGPWRGAGTSTPRTRALAPRFPTQSPAAGPGRCFGPRGAREGP